jgi:hypothetical protein
MAAYLARKISEYTLKKIADPSRRSSITGTEATRKVGDLLQKAKTFANRLDLPSGI